MNDTQIEREKFLELNGERIGEIDIHKNRPKVGVFMAGPHDAKPRPESYENNPSVLSVCSYDVGSIFMVDENRMLVIMEICLAPDTDEFYKEYARIFFSNHRKIVKIYYGELVETLDSFISSTKIDGIHTFLLMLSDTRTGIVNFAYFFLWLLMLITLGKSCMTFFSFHQKSQFPNAVIITLSTFRHWLILSSQEKYNY